MNGIPSAPLLTLIFLVVLCASQWMEPPLIICMGMLVGYYLYQKDDLNHEIQQFLTSTTNKQVIKSNGYKHPIGSMDPEITEIIHSLKKYRKYNKTEFEKGNDYIRMFMTSVRELESDIERPNQLFENASLYLKQSVNHFQSLSVSVPEHTMNQILHKQKDKEIKSPSEKVGHLCRTLHTYGYYRLYNLSLVLNQGWREAPDIYKKEIEETDIMSSNSYHIHEYH